MKYTQADIGVVGEGEVTVSELLERLSKDRYGDLSGIDGLIYRDHENRFQYSRPRIMSRNFDAYPWPDLEGFDYGHTIARASPAAHSLQPKKQVAQRFLNIDRK